MSAIAVFDSGLGGLTVLKEIRQQLPGENLIYFGDTARVPYGGKSRETVIRYSLEIGQFLQSQNIKMLVIGCNTASAYASDILAKEFQIPVFNVIDPLVEELSSEPVKHIAILGTSATIRSGVYQERLAKVLPGVKLTAVPCPLFVPIVEEHFQHHASTRLIIEEYLSPLKGGDVDTVILGCTHYPLLRQQIQDFLGDQVRIVDSAIACAKQIKKGSKPLSFNKSLSVNDKLKYFVSDDPEKFIRLGEQFLGTKIGSVEHVEIK